MPWQTLKKSSPGVQVFWLNRSQTIARLHRALQALKQQRPEIERVILFGSLGRGDAVPGSDADVLLVLGDSALPFADRYRYYVPEKAGIGVDVFAYTCAELEAMMAAGNEFVAQALREGIELD